jgi:predicted transcriptional regulator
LQERSRAEFVKQRGKKMPKRGWSEIAIDILEATLTPEKKMRIMYKSNLNYARFNRYFHELLRKGFMEEANDPEGKQVYRISKRGRALLAALKKARDLFSADEH